MATVSKYDPGGSSRRKMRFFFGLACAAILTALAVQAAEPESDPGAKAFVVNIQGPIGPATAALVRNGFEAARQGGARIIVLTMDTPGGLADTMREIIRSILESPVPVAAFVHPSGSRAASAGTYILYASHVAAMAPGTNLGAATPVRIGGGGGLPLPGKEQEPAGEKKTPAEETPSGDAMEKKLVNDAAAFIRSLAEMRGRNADWAEQAVREGKSLPVNDALEKNVIDVVAPDIGDLLKRIDGREVSVGGEAVTLKTAGLAVETYEPGWRIRLLSILTNPNIAFILMIVGVYGLIFEFANPGTIGPGVVGTICLLLGFYALNVLPVNYAGMALLLFSIVLMVAEAFVPSFGILGIGGIVSFVLAGMMLFKGDAPGFSVSWPVLTVTAAVSGGMLIFVLGYVWKSQRSPAVTGRKALLGKEGRVLEWSGGSGYVRVGGERWKAVGKEDLAPDDRVEVRGREGLVLEVKKKEGRNHESV